MALFNNLGKSCSQYVHQAVTLSYGIPSASLIMPKYLKHAQELKHKNQLTHAAALSIPNTFMNALATSLFRRL